MTSGRAELPQPFAGARILEIGDSIAVAGATKMLSDFGASVTKVESRTGSQLRRMGPYPDDRPDLELGAYHLALDTGKRSVVLDCTSPSGREVLIAVAARNDVVVTHQSPAEAVRVRDALRALGDDGPTIVVLTEHGLEGPFAARQENDLSLFAWSNRMLRHSFNGMEPLRYSPNVATMQWASTATAVTAAAIWGRRHDGQRRMIEVGGVEALAGSVDNWFVPWSFTGAETPRPAEPSKATYPPGIVMASDGYLAISAANEPFFSRLCAGMGHPEFASDPRFTNPGQKGQHYEEFMAHLNEYLRSRTRDEVFRELQSFGVMIAPILDISEAFKDAQAVARGSYVTIEQPGMNGHTIAGPPFRLDGAWRAGRAPSLGEHTFEVLTEVGYTRDEQLALFRAAVVG